jgi:signal transduction histidine kinase/ligand-binding sensor domain-containing protein/AraC-like DNA-binding protein/ActR/RegA family two-component response regulator
MGLLARLHVPVAHAQARFATAPATASGPQSWVHESWTVKDGLPVNSINTLLQDHAGYIWAATFDGLVRFDGIRFTVFNSANSEELPSNRIIQLKEGRDGSLWLITEQGHVVRFRDGRFTNVAFESGKPSPSPALLFVDSLGTVWVGTPEGLWTAQRDRLVRVGRGTLDARVTAITQRRDGSVWVGTDGAGIFRVSSDHQVTKVVTDPAVDADFVIRLVEDASGALWIGGNRGLWVLRDRVVHVKSSVPLSLASIIVQVPATGPVFAQASSGLYRIESDSAIPVASEFSTNGLRLWADADAMWSVGGQDVFRDRQRVVTLAERRVVTAAMFDREGSLWLGTDAGGLHRFKQALFTTYSVAEGIAYANVYATYADRSGRIWLGTWGKGASRLDPVTGRVWTVPSLPDPSAVNSFYQDATGAVWIGMGAFGSGVLLCTLPSMTCRAEGPSELRERTVFALYGDPDGRMWAGASGLLFRYDGKSWTSFPPSSGGPEATVRAFASTRDGALWMGTNGGGLTRYHDGTFARVMHADGLPSDLVRSLYQDADGWLWVGTEGRGLARLDPRAWGAESAASPNAARRIVRIGTKDGLFDEVIHQILEDDAGRLWMNTNRGIFWVPRAELNAFADGKVSRIHSTAYTERDGIRNREGNGGVQPAGAKGPDGRLWFPTQDGVVVVDPAKVRRERVAPPLVVEQIVARGEALRPERDSIALRPDERDVQIEYTALTFLEPNNVRFRYRLDPYDASWVDVGNRRTAFYTKVPPGRYTFVVEASDAAGGWYEPGTRLAVQVLPRVWETGSFRWAVVAALGMLVFAAVRLREARLRTRALQLERVVDERTAALRDRERELAERNAQLQSVDQAKTRFFANVSHELRTPLTLTIGPLEDLRASAGGDPKVERWLDIALRNSRRLLRLVNQILDVAKLDARAMHLAPRPLDLVPFTRGVVAAFAPVAERKGISLTVTTTDSLPGGFDADAVEKILTNLLSNAIKFTPSGGTVHVALGKEGASARLVVRDSGPGIPPDQIVHVFERFFQVDESTTRTQPGTGIGLSLVKELVELHGGTIMVESADAGTTFTATIPAQAGTRDIGTGDIGTGDIGTSGLGREAITGEDGSSALMASRPSPESRVPSPDDDGNADDVPTLLVVDDSADLRGYIRDHFAAGFRVVEASDGAEGIALARRHLPDVVLSDVMMPGTDGHELVRVLRSSTETDFLSIVLLTAQAEDESRLEGLERGADDYIVKPFDMRELDVRVRNLIASRRRLRERFSTVGTSGLGTRDSAGNAFAAHGHGGPTSVAPADAAYAERVRDAIRRGLADPDFGVGELADALSQDRSHLFRRVKQVFGESPSELIRRMRVEEGARLLTEGSATVTDVAYAVGFNSLSYFCHCFQQSYGVTPAAYRLSFRSEPPTAG